MLRILLCLSLTIAVLGAFSQAATYTKITNSGSMMSTPRLADNKAIADYLTSKYGANALATISKYSEEANWPEGMSTLDNRNKNRPQIENYRAYFMDKLPDGSALLWIPAAENKHMPYNMRPQTDIFFNLGFYGINQGSTLAPKFGNTAAKSSSKLDDLLIKPADSKPTQSGTAAYDELTLNSSSNTAKYSVITDAGSIYSGVPTVSKSYMEKLRSQLDEARVKDVVKYANSENWPAGLKADNALTTKAAAIKKLKTLYIADLPNNIVVLMVPAKDNSTAPADLKLSRDYYFVTEKGGVQLGQRFLVSGPTAGNSTQQTIDRLDKLLSADAYSTITDGGQLYSGVPSGLAGVDEAMRKQFSPEQVQDITKYAASSNQPVAFSDLLGIGNRTADLGKLKTRYIGDLPPDIAILWVPMADNANAPYHMKFTRDYYLVIKKKGVKLGQKTTPSGAGLKDNKPASATNINTSGTRFADQLPQIVADYANNFANVKGEKKPDDGMFKNNDYQSRIKLEGSQESYVASAMLSSRLSFIASYGNFGSKAEALRKFNAVVAQIDACRFPCCTFVKNDPLDYSSTYTQAWLPFDLSGKMGPSYEGIVMEVQMIKTVDIKGEFKGSDDVWTLVLRVRKL
jgi:hypothetical protein